MLEFVSAGQQFKVSDYGMCVLPWSPIFLVSVAVDVLALVLVQTFATNPVIGLSFLLARALVLVLRLGWSIVDW